jgi:hypothetical protein
MRDSLTITSCENTTMSKTVKALVEVVPVMPAPGYHWVAGHYRWGGNQWRWVPGHWRAY